MTILCELADNHQTDKGGRSTTYGGVPGDTCHNYTPAYHGMFGDRRDSVRRVLEVGVNAGSSLRMWEEYFPAATIVGFDIRREVLFTDGRVECHYADQSSRQSLLAAVAAAGGGPFDLIIDDGSHEDAHQITTAETLLPFLAPGGAFVIEDIHIDCRPESLADRIQAPAGFAWRAVECGVGIGKARCRPGCEFCGGSAGETLIVYERQS
jgi:demethylmacrocin O-methyltransferase